MGLDHTITLRKKLPQLNYEVGEPIHVPKDNKALKEAFHANPKFEYYMYKINFVQGYFERKYNVGNCKYVVITFEDIEEIQRHAQYIYKNRDLDYAQKHLPVTRGLCYGNYEYNERYLEDVETIARNFAYMLERAKQLPDTVPVYWCWY